MVHGFLLFYAIACLATPLSGTRKLDELHRRRSQSETGVIRLDPKAYKTYVLSQPRPYTIFICLSGPLTKFPALRGLETAFSKASLSYKLAHAVHDNTTRDVFFIIANAYSNKDISQWHGLNGIPVFAHVGPEMWKNPNKNASSYPISSKSQYDIRSTIAARELVHWANGFTRGSVQPFVSVSDRLYELSFTMCLVVLSIATLALGITVIRQFPKFMIISAFLIHCVAVSGAVSNIIEGRGPPAHGTPFFMPGMRGQYLREGVVVALTTITPSLCLIGLLNVHKYLPMPEMLSSAQLTLIVVAATASQLVVYFFKLKGGWYRDPPFWPFADFKTGSIYVDQGNTIFD